MGKVAQKRSRSEGEGLRRGVAGMHNRYQPYRWNGFGIRYYGVMVSFTLPTS
jgi:hypothetical protein